MVDIPVDKNIKDGSEKINFAPSGPPPGSGLHRYIFLLFFQQGKIGETKTSNPKGRKGFRVNQYAIDNGLGDPKCINYYCTEAI